MLYLASASRSFATMGKFVSYMVKQISFSESN
jgi:hypothetical protein